MFQGPETCTDPPGARGSAPSRSAPSPSSLQQKMTKSMSLTNLNNNQKGGPGSPGGPVDQDDILALTQQVKLFSDGLSHLKTVFTDFSGKTLI